MRRRTFLSGLLGLAAVPTALASKAAPTFTHVGVRTDMWDYTAAELNALLAKASLDGAWPDFVLCRPDQFRWLAGRKSTPTNRKMQHVSNFGTVEVRATTMPDIPDEMGFHLVYSNKPTDRVLDAAYRVTHPPIFME